MTGSSNVNVASQEQITNIVRILKAFPKSRIKVGGYTVNDGDDSSNKKLLQPRAAEVLTAIESLVIDAARLLMKAEGRIIR